MKHPNVKFVFIGLDNMNGQEAIKENNLSDHIVILGLLKMLRKTVKKSYIFVFLFILEGCPTSIIGSHEFKVPCIAYDICGINELIIDKKTGLLAKENDQEMLVKNICKLIENKVLYRKMSIASESRIKKIFTL